jgi:hypothetical protein
VRKHEYRRVIRRIVSPPSFPFLIGPCTTHRTKHVPTENPCTDISYAASRKFVIGSSAAGILPVHMPKGGRLESPSMQRFTADSKGAFKALTWPCAKSVDR